MRADHEVACAARALELRQDREQERDAAIAAVLQYESEQNNLAQQHRQRGGSSAQPIATSPGIQHLPRGRAHQPEAQGQTAGSSVMAGGNGSTAVTTVPQQLNSRGRGRPSRYL